MDSYISRLTPGTLEFALLFCQIKLFFRKILTRKDENREWSRHRWAVAWQPQDGVTDDRDVQAKTKEVTVAREVLPGNGMKLGDPGSGEAQYDPNPQPLTPLGNPSEALLVETADGLGEESTEQLVADFGNRSLGDLGRPQVSDFALGIRRPGKRRR